MVFLPELRIGLLNVWLPLSFYYLLMLTVSFAVNKEASMKGGDRSWVQKKDKVLMFFCNLTLGAVVLLSVWVPLRTGTQSLYIGAFLYAAGLVLSLIASLNFITTPLDQPVTRGLYQFSRNPAYVTDYIIHVSVIVASGSPWLTLLLIVRMLLTHFSILAEERYCCQEYGDEYASYFKKVPRYFGFPTGP